MRNGMTAFAGIGTLALLAGSASAGVFASTSFEEPDAVGGLRILDARDPTASTSKDTRNFAIVRGSWRLLDAVGVTAHLNEGIQPLNGLEAEDGARHSLGTPSVLFPASDLPETGFEDIDTLGFMVEAAPLQAALDDALAEAEEQGKLTWLRPARFSALARRPAGVELVLEDGRTLSAALVAGCDGVASAVRQALDIGVEGRNYGKSVFAANVTLSRPHHGIARQRFTPEGPFATLPLSGDRANLAWYLRAGAAEALARRTNEEIEAELNHRLANFAGTMHLDGPASAYPLKLQIARDMIAERGALVGDAARRINPLAGQGLNLGFKDVAALAELVVEAVRTGRDPGAADALSRYSAWRRPDATATALAMDMIERVYSNDNPLVKPARAVALRLADRVAPLRRTLARQASATQAHLPKLMRGEAL